MYSTGASSWSFISVISCALRTLLEQIEVLKKADEGLLSEMSCLSEHYVYNPARFTTSAFMRLKEVHKDMSRRLTLLKLI